MLEQTRGCGQFALESHIHRSTERCHSQPCLVFALATAPHVDHTLLLEHQESESHRHTQMAIYDGERERENELGEKERLGIDK